MSGLPRMQPLVPRSQLVLLLLLCGVGIWLLLPDDREMLEKLVQDGETAEARRLLEKIPRRERNADPLRFRTLELELAKRDLAPGDAAAHARYVAQIAAAWRETAFAPALFDRLLAALPALADPAAAWTALAPDLAGAPAAQRQTLGAAFTRAALGANQPIAAAEIFAATRAPAERTPADRLELARLWQQAGRPADALDALGDDESAEAQPLRLALLRALNRNRDALALLARRAGTATTGELVDEIVAVALAAGVPAEAVPVAERYLAANPGDVARWRRLRELLVGAGRTADAVAAARHTVAAGNRDPGDVAALARVLEWTGEAAGAFDAWLELARAGDLAALDRVAALNPGLFRDRDYAKVLAGVVPVSGRPDYTLALARLSVTLGDYDRARTAFTAYLAARDDFDVWIEFGHLHRELYRFADAEAAFRRASALRPGDLGARRETAECLVLLGRYPEALEIYGELLPRSADEEIVGPYVRLAESLGRFDAFADGLRRRIAATPEPDVRDYTMLAYAYELGADPVRRRAAIDEGLRRFPASNDLRLQLAYLLSSELKFRAAQSALAPHTRLREDLNALLLYLDLMRLNNDVAAERSFLAQPVSAALAGDDGVLERIARVREAHRDYAEAERLWRTLHGQRPRDFARAADLARVLLLRGRTAEAKALLAPFLRAPTPAVLRLAAEISTSAGDQRAAERYQLAYLAAVQSAPPADWGALGDIRLSRGDRTGAKRAYAEALRRLHATIAAKGGTS